MTTGDRRLLSLSGVVLIRPHRPEPLIMARGKRAIGLRGIAVDQRSQIHWVGGAAHLVLDGEQGLAAGKIDDIAKAVLILSLIHI